MWVLSDPLRCSSILVAIEINHVSHLLCIITVTYIREVMDYSSNFRWNEMKWKCSYLKCVRKPTRSRLIHTIQTNPVVEQSKIIGWSVSPWNGLGLDVSVSRRSRDVPTSRLGLVSRKIVNVSVSVIYVSCPRPMH